MKCTCFCPQAISQVDPLSWSVMCAVHGTNYYYWSNENGWETSKQRMERMKRTHKCVKCGANFYDYLDTMQSRRSVCDRCHEQSNVMQEEDPEFPRPRRSTAHRRNIDSPWRIGVAYATKSSVSSGNR
jgi:DNA-directed RNA polymerase subunit RPC12/RpoP